MELKIIAWSKINLPKINVSYNKIWVSGKVKSTPTLSLSKQPNAGQSNFLYPHRVMLKDCFVKVSTSINI